jgi:hypothetical protein
MVSISGKVSRKLKEYLKAKRNSNFKERIIAKKGGRTWYAEKNKNSWEENAEKKWKAGFLLFKRRC